MRFTVRNDRGQIPGVIARIEDYLQTWAVPRDTVITASLCLDEILTNAADYAFPDGEPHEVSVEVAIDDGVLFLDVIDDGMPFDPWQDAPEPDTEAPLEKRRIGGLGIHLVKNLMDEVAYQRVGARNHLSLRKRLAADSAQDV